MHVLAASGGTVEVESARRRAWPLAGTQYQTEHTQSWAGLRLSALPTGESRILAYRRIYRSNPWVWAAVNSIAGGISAMPLRTYGWGSTGERVPYRSELPRSTPGPPSAGARLDRLLQHPAPFISRRRTVRRAAVDKLVYGNGLWAKEPDGAGGVVAIYNCPWRQISVIAGNDTPILGYRVLGTSGTKTWSQPDVVQFGEGDADGPLAPSPLESLQWTIALMDAMGRFFTSMFQNQMRPSGVLKFDAMPGDDELKVLREEIQQLYAGLENSGRPLITSGTWSPMDTGQSYKDVIELARLSREEVAAGYHIPPPVMGILDGAIKANVAELREMFLREVVAPFGSEMTDEIDAQLIDPNPTWSGLMTGFDMSAQLLPDFEAMALAFKNIGGVFSVNELRRMAGLGDLPYDWANVPWAAPGQLPMTLAPQGATISPENADTDVDPDLDQVIGGDDEEEEDIAA